ncbi:hypothetical protein C8Q78DRAFT_1005807 [Trametes maxima]|nr:hypothetical protein C8Q78DRAFT_1005807 [Trametes maxima]
MLAQTAFTIFQYFPWAAFSALRVLALSRWNWFLATATFLLALGPAAVNLTRYGFDLTGANLLTLGCKTSNDATMLQGNILSAVSRTSLILSDTLVIGVTVAMTWRRGATLAWQGVGTSLSDLLLNHGIKYYAVLLCLNILQVVLTHLDIGTVSQQASYISTVSEPLTAIFISRFLLDLQSANQTSLELCSGAGENPLTANTDGTLRFAARSRVIGSLGASTAPDSASIYFEEDGC